MTISERLITFRQFLGLNQKQIAEKLDIHPRNWSRYEKGDVSLPEEVLLGLYGLGLNILWLYTGQGDMGVIDKAITFISGSSPASKPEVNNLTSSRKEIQARGQSVDLPLPDASSGGKMEYAPEEGGAPGSTSEAGEGTLKADVVRTSMAPGMFRDVARKEIPVIVEGEEPGLLIPVVSQGVSAGYGFEYDEGETVRYLKIPSWIARRGRDLVALPVYGDSMEPTVHQGEMIVCDSGGFKDNGLYVLRDETRGLYLCKRIAWTPGGWVIMSDNPRYEQMEVKDKDIEIVARVLAAIKEVK